MKGLKFKALRKLVQARAWANTPDGEKIIVRTLSILTVVAFLNLILLILG